VASGILFLTRPERPVASHIAQSIVVQPSAGGALVGWAGAF
jgi:hypothetical protein